MIRRQNLKLYKQNNNIKMPNTHLINTVKRLFKTHIGLRKWVILSSLKTRKKVPIGKHRGSSHVATEHNLTSGWLREGTGRSPWSRSFEGGPGLPPNIVHISRSSGQRAGKSSHNTSVAMSESTVQSALSRPEVGFE